MPRGARVRSESGIYHVMMRGVGGQDIFVEDEACIKYLEILDRYRRECGFEIYAYCLMRNHLHLLIKEGMEPLSRSVKRIGVSYVYWYNWQYGRKGHLFQDRYRSEPVEDDAYFLTVLRYIHQNPVKAGIVDYAGAYKWSSYGEYFDRPFLVNADFVLGMFARDRKEALKMFAEFNNEVNDGVCLDVDDERDSMLPDKEVMELAKKMYGLDLARIRDVSPARQREVLRSLKKEPGISVRQLSRLTGLSVSRVFRA